MTTFTFLHTESLLSKTLLPIIRPNETVKSENYDKDIFWIVS